ncbi:MAG TPA: metal-dependent hydrolase [Verrucomicrobiae bacterium]|nr:metal-dependent hydrolase [Verrucomicrobiae bacterium]
MNFTYHGHACFSIETGGKHLLFDPYIKPNPLAKSVDLKKIPADYILVSHGHDDHMADALKIAKRTKAMVIANYEVANWLEKKGARKVHAFNPGGEATFDFGKVKSVNAIHSSSLPDGSYGGAASGFVVQLRDVNFYYSGDTALTQDMKLIADGPKLNFAVLCIGGNFTMGVDDAVRAAGFIGCNEIIGVHYDTFPEIKINHAEAEQKFAAGGKRLHLLRVGERRQFV